VRASGLIWGGIAYEELAFTALLQASVGRHLPQLNEGADDWRVELVDDHNPAHHWVAAFVTGFCYGALFGAAANAVRDVAQIVTGLGGTPADIRLGTVAAKQGGFLRRAGRPGTGMADPYPALLEQMDQSLRVGRDSA
jgi:hypothetical protein